MNERIEFAYYVRNESGQIRAITVSGKTRVSQLKQQIANRIGFTGEHELLIIWKLLRPIDSLDIDIRKLVDGLPTNLENLATALPAIRYMHEFFPPLYFGKGVDIVVDLPRGRKRQLELHDDESELQPPITGKRSRPRTDNPSLERLSVDPSDSFIEAFQASMMGSIPSPDVIDAQDETLLEDEMLTAEYRITCPMCLRGPEPPVYRIFHETPGGPSYPPSDCPTCNTIAKFANLRLANGVSRTQQNF